MRDHEQTDCLRIAKWAFRYATQGERGNITVFHGANIMKMTDGMFLRAAQRIRNAYDRALTDGANTRDLGGDLGTSQFAQAVIDRL